jgi:hypothetical protein
MRILILGLLGLLLLAPPAFSQISVSYGGCLVRADLTSSEIIEGACAPRVVRALVEHLDIACTASLQEEAATLSMAAATEEGLTPEAAARLKILEAVCPSGPPGAPQPPLFLLGAIPLWVRRRCKKLGIDPTLGSRWTENGWLFNPLSEAQGRPRNYPSRGSFYIDKWVEVKTPIEMFNSDREEYLYCDIFDTNGVEEELVTILWDPEQKQYAMETDQGLTWGWIPANSGCYPKAAAFLKEMRRLGVMYDVSDRIGRTFRVVSKAPPVINTRPHVYSKCSEDWGGQPDSPAMVRPDGAMKTRDEVEKAMDSYRMIDFDELCREGYHLLVAWAPIDPHPIQGLEIAMEDYVRHGTFRVEFAHHCEVREVWHDLKEREDVLRRDWETGEVHCRHGAIEALGDDTTTYEAFVRFGGSSYRAVIHYKDH